MANKFSTLELTLNQKKIVYILGAYGIVQILAQDLGIKTGKKQRDLVQKIPVQIALFFSASYLITSDVSLSLITISIYFGLKYYYSEGKTSPVCFEEI